jgi:hypothetical protein
MTNFKPATQGRQTRAWPGGEITRGGGTPFHHPSVGKSSDRYGLRWYQLPGQPLYSLVSDFSSVIGLSSLSVNRTQNDQSIFSLTTLTTRTLRPFFRLTSVVS